MKNNKQIADITRINNPMEIKHFLSFGAYFHIKANKKARPCTISLADVPILDFNGVVATFEDGSSEIYNFKDLNKIWQIGFSV